MERFWRTLRDGCLNHLGSMTSLHDVQVRLLAYLDQRYHATPRTALMGKTPRKAYEHGRSSTQCGLTEAQLAHTLTVHGTRRVRRDGTLDVGGTTWETTTGFSPAATCSSAALCSTRRASHGSSTKDSVTRSIASTPSQTASARVSPTRIIAPSGTR